MQYLVLNTMAGFQLTPCKAIVFTFSSSSIFLTHRVFLNPVKVLGNPFFCILFILSLIIHFTHRYEPIMAVKLITQFIVFHRPVSPVYIIAIKIWRIAIMCLKYMSERIICLFPVVGSYFHVFQIQLRLFYSGSITII